MIPATPVALAIATAVPLVFLILIYTRDLYRTGAFDSVLLCFAWGMVAFGLAVALHSGLTHGGLIPFITLSRYIAPFTEETLKALILIFLSRRRGFTYFVDGAIFGFAVGIGFAIAENFSYVLGGSGSTIMLAVGRVISSNLVHAAASSLVGVTLGLARFQRAWWQRVLYLAIGLALAISMHAGFNYLVSQGYDSALLLYAYAASVGLGGSLVILLIIRRGLAEERQWIEETLGEADRITAGEAAVVRRLAEAGVILTPLVEKLGQRQATRIGRLLVLQAQLGILRKTLQKLPDEEARHDVEAQIQGLRDEVDVARRQVGAYGMLLLRSIFPEDIRPIWRRIETAIGFETTDSTVSIADLLTDLPPAERRVMRLMLRHRGGLSLEQIAQKMNELPKERRPEPETLRAAVDALVQQRWLVMRGEAPVTYEKNLGRKAGLALGEDIWGALAGYTQQATATDANVWPDIAAAIKRQAATASPECAPLWSRLDQRIQQTLRAEPPPKQAK